MTTRIIFRYLFSLLACQLKIIRVVLQLQHTNKAAGRTEYYLIVK